MKKYLVAAVMSFVAYGAVHAGVNLDALAAESSVAASYGDLNTARALAGKRMDGGFLRVSGAEAVAIGKLVLVEKEYLKITESRKVSLKPGMPALDDKAGRPCKGKCGQGGSDPSSVSEGISDAGGLAVALFTVGLLLSAAVCPPLFIGLSIAAAFGILGLELHRTNWLGPVKSKK